MNVIQEAISHPDSSLRFLRLQSEGFRGQRHRHHHLELTWIERGHGLRSVGDHVEPFSDGDLVLLGPQLAHEWTTRGRALSVATVLQFAPDLFSSERWPELRALQGPLRHVGRGLRIVGATHDAVVRQLTAMVDHDDIGRLAALFAILSLLRRGGGELQPISRTAARGGANAEGARRIDRVIDWIHRHQAQELGLEAAAAVAHVTPAAFSRFFRRQVGKTFVEYVNDVRCSAACAQLQRTTLPVAHIALACGFATLSNFNVQFRRRYGQSPSALRRQGG